jgi:hypothetical protein
MSRDDFISGSIKNILKDGINLFLESEEEEQHYADCLFQFLHEETEFPTYLRKGRLIEVENLKMQIAVEIIISDGILYFVPYVADVFEIFTEVLKFIAYKHQEVVTDFRGSEETRIESIKEVNKVQNDQTEKKYTEEESSSDDDYEWI